MAGSRTLKLSILADVDDLKKKLSAGSTEVEGFGSKLGDFSKKAGIAFAAAGAAAAAYAGKLLVDGVKAAVEDEKAQAALATTLKNVTTATDSQIAAVEKYITQTSLAKGVTDDQLRPSLDRLIKSTGDVAEAQRLQTLALDIAAGSGRSLESVSAALGRAYDGNTSALSRLGVGLTSAELKTMTFDEVTKSLSDTFGGQATVQAETFSGKLDRLKIAFDEGKETAGSFILDAITPLVTLLVEKVIPVVQDLATNIGEDLKPVFEDISTFFTQTLIPIFKEWWDFLNTILIPGIKKTVQPILDGLFTAFSKISKSIKDNEDNLKPLFTLFKSVATFVSNTLAPAIGTILGTALKVVSGLISGLITGFSKLVGFIDDVVSGIRQLINLVKDNPLVRGISDLITSTFGGGRAAGGSVNARTAYTVGENGPELFVPGTSGRIVPNLGNAQGVVINVYAPSVIDQEGFSRAVIDALNSSERRSGAGSSQLVG